MPIHAAGTPAYGVPKYGAPFAVRFPAARIADLQRRLAARPAAPQAAGRDDWRTGPPESYLGPFLDEWRDGFDWRAAEDMLNSRTQFLIPAAGPGGATLDIHVIVERGSNPELPPVVMTHGWPSLPYEFLGLIDRIAHPERSGGRADDGATVILPSLPGFGFSSAPVPLHARDVARAWCSMMHDAFACPRFFTHGGDWGAVVSSWIALDSPQSLIGLHLSMLGLRPTLDPAAPLDDDEKRWIKEVQRRLALDGGYREQQATRPTTLAYGLADSPALVAAWLLDKYHGWCGTGPTAAPRLPRRAMLDLVNLYWFSSSLATAGWIYHADRTQRNEPAPGARCEVPTGVAFFGNGFFPPPPTRWVERLHDLRLRRDWPDGGHFPSLLAPDALAESVAECHRHPAFRG
ncbi:MAG: epoxide hydrolase family protein [Burkholderiaceae bacterium]